MSKKDPHSPIRVLLLLKGKNVAQVITEGQALDVVALQFDSGEFTPDGFPVLGMQRGGFIELPEAVGRYFQISDRLPTLPWDEDHHHLESRER